MNAPRHVGPAPCTHRLVLAHHGLPRTPPPPPWCAATCPRTRRGRRFPRRTSPAAAGGNQQILQADTTVALSLRTASSRTRGMIDFDGWKCGSEQEGMMNGTSLRASQVRLHCLAPWRLPSRMQIPAARLPPSGSPGFVHMGQTRRMGHQGPVQARAQRFGSMGYTPT